jgi:hypothetical protein
MLAMVAAGTTPYPQVPRLIFTRLPPAASVKVAFLPGLPRRWVMKSK